MVDKKNNWDQIHTFLLRKSKPYPKLNKLISSNKKIIITKSKQRNLYSFMCRIVVGQQLSTAAARTLNERLEELCKKEGKKLSELCYEENFDLIRTCGLSKNKVMAMIKLNQTFNEKKISAVKLRQLEDEELKNFISNLWGFGPWSAEMILLGYFGSLDIWSNNDSALVRGINLALGKQKKSHDEIIELFSPYRTLLSRHIWKGLDEGKLK